MGNRIIDNLIEIDPRLKKLRNEALAIMADSPGDWTNRNRIWSLDLKPRFERLVGFEAEKPELQSCEVYNVLYREFVNILKV